VGEPIVSGTTVDRRTVDELKTRVDLAEVVRQCGVELKPTGKNLLGRCPFHDDQTASLSVNPRKQLWKCFGCQEGGDVLNFLQLKEKVEFPQALDRLKSLAGDAPARTNGTPAPAPDGPLPGNFRRDELLSRVVQLYREGLRESAPAQAYLKERGLDSRELMEAFQLGFSDGRNLARLVPTEGPLREAMIQLGVLNDSGQEHFRGCLVVPLTHPDEGVVGLYGRRIRPDASVRHLYLPGPRRGVLNWQALKASPQIVIAESVLDALSLWKAGLREVTCLYGVQGLPRDLEALLERCQTQEAVFCLDADPAGQEAVERLSEVLAARGVRCLAVDLPEGQDPNQLLVAGGPERLLQAARQRRPVERAAPAAAAPVAQAVEPTADGFTLRLGDVSYRVTPLPPFTQRLRIQLRGMRGTRLLLDKQDLWLQKSRKALVNQFINVLGLARVEAERHLGVLVEECERWVEALKARSEANPTTSQAVPEMTAAQREEALAFLRQVDLVDQLLTDMEAFGYVGEENAKLLVYLIGLSRKLPKPLSGIIISQSGTGKSTLTELVEALSPPEEVLLFSRVTGQAFHYVDQQFLMHKLVIVEERAGAEAADYSIRVLQSRQRLTQAVPVKDPATGQIRTQILSVEGPVAYLETTTDPHLNHENATRCFEITLDETEEQTQRIHALQQARRLPARVDRHRVCEAIATRHHNAQRLLEPVLIFIPYAGHISFPSKKLRTRRDHERFLCLIEASAFLHQHQRERGVTEDGSPYVLATVDDYRLAHRLAKDVLASTLHELSREACELWQSIRTWVLEQGADRPGDVLFTRRDLRLVLTLEDHRLRANLGELVEMEYLEVVAGSNGRAFHYRLLVTQESATSLALLAPEELERRWKEARG